MKAPCVRGLHKLMPPLVQREAARRRRVGGGVRNRKTIPLASLREAIPLCTRGTFSFSSLPCVRGGFLVGVYLFRIQLCQFYTAGFANLMLLV